MFTEAKSQRTRERVSKSLPQRNLALVTCSLYSPTHQIKSNQNTFVQTVVCHRRKVRTTSLIMGISDFETTGNRLKNVQASIVQVQVQVCASKVYILRTQHRTLLMSVWGLM